MKNFSQIDLAKVSSMMALARTQPYIPCIDLEATCTDDPQAKAAYPNEVIEVGWVILRPAARAVLDKRQLYAKPTTTSVTPFCTTLTGITPATLENAPSFRELMAQVTALLTRHELGRFPIWASFGDYDRKQFERQCAREGVKNPFEGLEHINIKSAVAVERGATRGGGLQRALSDYGMKFIGRHHCGADDAFNAARVLGRALKTTT